MCFARARSCGLARVLCVLVRALNGVYVCGLRQLVQAKGLRFGNLVYIILILYYIIYRVDSRETSTYVVLLFYQLFFNMKIKLRKSVVRTYVFFFQKMTGYIMSTSSINGYQTSEPNAGSYTYRGQRGYTTLKYV